MLQEATIARKARRTDEVITGERQSAIAPMEENPQGPPFGEELTMLKSAPPQAQVQGCASVSFPIYPQPNPVINAKLQPNPYHYGLNSTLRKYFNAADRKRAGATAIELG